MSAFPQKANKKLKILVLAIAGCFGFTAYLLLEPKGDYEYYTKILYKEIFKFEIFGQFAIFNLVTLCQNLASVLMVMVVNLTWFLKVNEGTEIQGKINKNLKIYLAFHEFNIQFSPLS
jgi:hypothetical protein